MTTFSKKEKGYVSWSSDLSMQHYTTIPLTCVFLELIFFDYCIILCQMDERPFYLYTPVGRDLGYLILINSYYRTLVVSVFCYTCIII